MRKAVGSATSRAHPARRSQSERPVGGVENVDSHVTQGSGAEIVQFAPVFGVIDFVFVVVLRGYAQPQVPIEVRRNGIGVARHRGFVATPLLVRPDVHGTDLSDESSPHVFGGHAVTESGGILNAELRRQTGRFGE